MKKTAVAVLMFVTFVSTAASASAARVIFDPVSSKISISSRADSSEPGTAELSGRVVSPNGVCSRDRTVILKRVGPGIDVTVATEKTDTNGSWTVRRVKAGGPNFYAIAEPRINRASGYVCSPDTSPVVSASGAATASGIAPSIKLAPSKVSISLDFNSGNSSEGRYTGKVESGVERCRQGRVVVTKKVGPEVDAKVSKDSSNKTGEWTSAQSDIADGGYYAIVEPRPEYNYGHLCLPDTSKVVFAR